MTNKAQDHLIQTIENVIDQQLKISTAIDQELDKLTKTLEIMRVLLVEARGRKKNDNRGKKK